MHMDPGRYPELCLRRLFRDTGEHSYAPVSSYRDTGEHSHAPVSLYHVTGACENTGKARTLFARVQCVWTEVVSRLLIRQPAISCFTHKRNARVVQCVWTVWCSAYGPRSSAGSVGGDAVWGYREKVRERERERGRESYSSRARTHRHTHTTRQVVRCQFIVRQGQQLQEIAAIYSTDWLQLWCAAERERERASERATRSSVRGVRIRATLLQVIR